MQDWLTRLWRSPYLPLCLVLLASAGCKIALLGSRELWLDETYSAFEAHLPFRELLRFSSGDVHPPLFSILLWTWVNLVGDEQAQLRLFSVLLNIFSMIAMFFLGRRALGVRFGAFAAILFALSPILFVYSLEVRSYMLFVFVFICLLLVHWIVAVEQKASPGLIAIYGALATLLFYIHYLGIFILLGLFAHWAIVSDLQRDRLRKLCTVGVLTAVLVSPGVYLLLHQYHLKVQSDQRLKLSNADSNALSFGDTEPDSARKHQLQMALIKSGASVAGFYPAKMPLLFFLFAVPLACVLAGAGFLVLPRHDKVCQLFILVLLTIMGGVLCLHLANIRYILPLIPVTVLAIARVLQFWVSTVRWRSTALAIGMFIFGLYLAGFYRQAFRPHGHPWQNVVAAIQKDYRAGDQVVFDALYAQVPFDYFAIHQHFQPRETGFPISIYDWWTRQSHTAWGGPVMTKADLNQFLATRPGTKTLWLVSFETYYYDPHEALLAELRRRGEVTEVALPPDPDSLPSQQDSHPRLIRVTLH